MAPCLLGYGVVGQQLHSDVNSKKVDNLYWSWIENYVAEDYVTAVKTGSGKRIPGMKALSSKEATLSQTDADERSAGEACRAPESDTDTRTNQDLYTRHKGKVEISHGQQIKTDA